MPRTLAKTTSNNNDTANKLKRNLSLQPHHTNTSPNCCHPRKHFLHKPHTRTRFSNFKSAPLHRKCAKHTRRPPIFVIHQQVANTKNPRTDAFLKHKTSEEHFVRDLCTIKKYKTPQNPCTDANLQEKTLSVSVSRETCSRKSPSRTSLRAKNYNI